MSGTRLPQDTPRPINVCATRQNENVVNELTVNQKFRQVSNDDAAPAVCSTFEGVHLLLRQPSKKSHFDCEWRCRFRYS
jgi:hypothetical protein